MEHLEFASHCELVNLASEVTLVPKQKLLLKVSKVLGAQELRKGGSCYKKSAQHLNTAGRVCLFQSQTQRVLNTMLSSRVLYKWEKRDRIDNDNISAFLSGPTG